METDTPQMNANESDLDIAHNNARLSWLDQLRGIVLIFLFISSLTWIFSADIRGGGFPIGPTWLNRGFKYVDFYPRMITLIDLGSEIFLIIIGISLALSFQRKIRENNQMYAWITIFYRVFVFFWLAEVMESNYLIWELNDIIIISSWGTLTIAVLVLRCTVFTRPLPRKLLGLVWALISLVSWFFKNDSDIQTIFLDHELSLIAWGTLMGAIFLRLIKKPDIRMLLPFILLIAHFYLWAEFRNFSVLLFKSTPFEFNLGIPFKLMSAIIVSITGTCIWDWMQIVPSDQRVGIRKRIVPLMVITCILHFIVDFFQTADSEGLNVSLTLLAIAFSLFLLLCVYGIDKYVRYHAKFLMSIGANGLFLFLLQAILTIPYNILWPEGGTQFRENFAGWLELVTGQEYIPLSHPLINLFGLLAFILPIAILITTSLILNKYKIRVKV